MRILDVEVLVAPMATSWLTERVIANPMSIYPEYAERRSSWYRRMSAGLVRVTAEDGTEGLGFVGCAKAGAARVALEEQVRELVVGKDCFATELISEQLFRATVFYGLGGFTQSLISGIEIALWDLKGKLLEHPVYDLLGGKTMSRLRPSLTSWNADALEQFGIRDVKIAVPYGLTQGEQGMRANEQLVARTREAIGPDGFIALDCYTAWDVPYAVEMARRLCEYRIEWIEEPVMPEDVLGYRQIQEQVDCMVTGGEHTYTLEDFRRLIVDGGVDVVQPDIYRAGGADGPEKSRRCREGLRTEADLPRRRRAHLPLPHLQRPRRLAALRVPGHLRRQSRRMGTHSGPPAGGRLPRAQRGAGLRLRDQRGGVYRRCRSLPHLVAIPNGKERR